MSPGGVALSADNKTLYGAVTAGTGTNLSADILVYNAATGALLNTINVVTSPSTDSIRGIDVDPSTGYIYAALNNGNIAQVNPTTSAVNLTWGTAVVSGQAMGDLQIFNGTLYAGGIKAGYNLGVYSWDLSSGGTATLLGSTNTKADGIAFAPDGTLYTAEWAGPVQKWSPTDGYATPTQVIDYGKLGLNDIDYYNGYLYVGRRTDNVAPFAGEIAKLNPTSGASTAWLELPEGTANSAIYPQFMVIGPTVPEPSTLVLLAAGLFGLMAYAWRKRK